MSDLAEWLRTENRWVWRLTTVAVRRQFPTWSYRPSPEETELAAVRLFGWIVWLLVMAVLIVTVWPVAGLWILWKARMAARRRVRRKRGLSGRTVLGRR